MHLSPQVMETQEKMEYYKAALQETRGKIETLTQSREKNLKKFKRTSKQYNKFMDDVGDVLKDLSRSDLNDAELVPGQFGSSS